MKALYSGVLVISFISGCFMNDFTESRYQPIQDNTIECEMVVEETPVCDVVVDETPISDIVVEQPEIISLGTCKVTAYCCENYPHICNDGDSTTTATGTTPTAGRTVAVDPKTIPYGSEVIIDGHTYIAEDCGGAIQGNRVDIVFATHDEALNFGVQYIEVSYIKQ